MDNLPIPLSRVELYLAKACGMDVTTPEPGPGIEQFLYAIAYNTTPPVAGYRTEEWLAYVQGVTPAKPLELEGSCIIGNQKVDVKYFAVAAGMPGATLPEKPQNRKEKYWEYIATHRPTPGVLKYVTGTNITLTDVVRGIEELQFVYGDTYQQTYSGANLFNVNDSADVGTGTTVSSDGFISQSCDNSSGSSTQFRNYFTNNLDLQTSTQYTVVFEVESVSGSGSMVVVNNNAQSQSTDQKEYYFSSLHAGDTMVTQFITKSSFSSAIYGIRSYSRFNAGDSGSITFRISVLADTSVTPETFIYQPYTGGIPAPNPDYPQDIQVVTGEQTVEVTGKNKINGSYSRISQTARCTAEASGNGFKITSTASSGATYVTVPIPNITALLGQTVTVSYVATGDGVRARFYYLNSSGGAMEGIVGTETATLPNSLGSHAGIGVVFYTSNNSSATYNDIQLEIGSTSTAYQAYQSQSYTISLGSTELCKIGDYRDKIFNNDPNEDWYDPDLEDNAWYVHKEIAKYTFTGTETWSTSPYGTNSWRLVNIISFPFDANELQIISNIFTGIKNIDRNTAGSNVIYSASGTELDIRNTSLTTLAEVQAATNGNYAYYALATPTDTKITDATLVGQLEAIDSAVLPKPIAYITVGAPDPNLPGPLKISYYGEEE